jgi:hypothetical protein
MNPEVFYNKLWTWYQQKLSDPDAWVNQKDRSNQKINPIKEEKTNEGN